MIIENNEKENKKYYEEIMYISSNYYIFKKNPKTRVHSLNKVFLLYIIFFLILFFASLWIPQIIILSGVTFILCVIYIYLFVETNYKLREYRKHNNSTIKIDKTGIENIEENQVSSKLFWDAIEYIIINKHSICFLPKNFAHFAIFIEISAKDKVYEALKKYDKLNLLIDNSNKYK